MDLYPTSNQAPQDLLRSGSLATERSLSGAPKRLVSCILSVAFAFLTGFFLSRYFADQASLTLVLLVVGIYVVVAYFDALLGSPSRTHRAGVLTLQAAALVVWVPRVNWALTITFLVIIFGILVGSEIHLRRELQYVTQIRFFRLARPFISNMVTLVVLAMLVFYLPGVAAGEPLLSPKKLDQFGGVVENVMHVLYPSLPEQATAGSVAELIVQRQFETNSAYQTLSPEDKQAAVEQGRNQLLNEFGSSTGVRVQPADQFGSLAGSLLQSSADRWRLQYGPWFLVFWLVVTFIVVRSAGFIFSFLVSAVAYGIYHALLAWKIILLEGESTMRETVSYT